jgi:hypothetical protein
MPQVRALLLKPSLTENIRQIHCLREIAVSQAMEFSGRLTDNPDIDRRQVHRCREVEAAGRPAILDYFRASRQS